MTTYRERRLARAERLRGWAENRERAARAQLESQPELRHDWAFITQPGRIPERERMNRADDRAYRSMQKAERMTDRADEIERQADQSIYTDDDDATERLADKIARLEVERDRIKAYNAACRKAKRATAEAVALLDEHQRAEIADIARVAAWQLGQNGEWPSYGLSNLSANIGRLRKRLDWIERGAEKFLTTRRPDNCSRCGADVPIGSTVAYSKTTRTLRHYPACPA